MDRLFEVRRPADPPGEPPAQRARDCPLCRAPLRVAEARPEAALAARAEGACPQLYRQRQAEIQQVCRGGRLGRKAAEEGSSLGEAGSGVCESRAARARAGASPAPAPLPTCTRALQECARLAARRVEHPTLCFGNLHQLRIPEVGSGNVHDWCGGGWARAGLP